MRTRSERSTKSVILFTVSVFIAVAALPLALCGCGVSAIFSPNPQGQLATALEPALGAVLAEEVALAWAPCLADSAECDAAANAEDFVRYQRAHLSYQTSFTKAVDETIRILDMAPDQSWRKEMVVEFHRGGGLPDYLLMADGTNFLECFPLPHLILPDVEDTDWYFRGRIDHPGEAAGALLGGVRTFQALGRLGMYFLFAANTELYKAFPAEIE